MASSCMLSALRPGSSARGPLKSPSAVGALRGLRAHASSRTVISRGPCAPMASSSAEPSMGDNSAPVTKSPCPVMATANVQTTAYTALTAAYAATGAAIVAFPWKFVELFVGLPAGMDPLSNILTGVFCGYFFLFASIAYSLSTATEHGRMGSETYKRLNLGLFWTSINVLFLQALYHSAIPATLAAAGAALFGSTAIISGATHTNTSGSKFSITDQISGLQDGIRGLFIYENWTAGFYTINALACVVFWILLVAMPYNYSMFQGVLSPLNLYYTKKLGAGLLLTGVTCYVLKDAAARERLGASTFKTLNLGLAATAVAQAYYYTSARFVDTIVLNSFLNLFVVATALGAAVVSVFLYFMSKK